MTDAGASPLDAAEAEASLLGAILVDPECLTGVRAGVSAKDFASRRNALIYGVMLDLGTGVDVVTVARELEARGKLADAGDRAYLVELQQTVPHAVHAMEYARQVAEAARRRRVLAGLNGVAKAARTGSPDDIARLTSALATEGAGSAGRRPPAIYAANSLEALDLPEPSFTVAEVLPEGLALLVGNPKLGKSLLALCLLVSVASGATALGKFPTVAGDVLYLDLEGSERRMKKRLRDMLNGEPIPPRLFVVHEWPRSDEGGLEHLEEWLKAHPAARLVVIDTLARFASRPRNRNENAYEGDYARMAPIQSLASKYGVTILLVTHRRKAEAADVLETVNGSNGLAGSADSILILSRERGRADAFLFVTGRDIREQDLALRCESGSGIWTVLGEAEEYRLGQTTTRVMEAIELCGRPVTPKEVAETLDERGKGRDKIKHAMRRLAGNGRLRVSADGRYRLPQWPEPAPGVPDVPKLPASPTILVEGDRGSGTPGTPGTVGTPGKGGRGGASGSSGTSEDDAVLFEDGGAPSAHEWEDE